MLLLANETLKKIKNNDLVYSKKCTVSFISLSLTVAGLWICRRRIENSPNHFEWLKSSR